MKRRTGHAGGAQIGALVLGSKETDQPYSEEDLMLLDDLADQLVIVIQASRLQEESARAINQDGGRLLGTGARAAAASARNAG